jgi:ribosomal protein S4E
MIESSQNLIRYPVPAQAMVDRKNVLKQKTAGHHWTNNSVTQRILVRSMLRRADEGFL